MGMGCSVPSDYTPEVFERPESGVAWQEQLVSVPLKEWTETNIALAHYREQTEAWRVRWAEENDRRVELQGEIRRLGKEG